MQPNSFKSELPYLSPCGDSTLSLRQTLSFASLSKDEAKDLTLYFAYEYGLFQINGNETLNIGINFNGQFGISSEIALSSLLSKAQPKGRYSICEISVPVGFNEGGSNAIEITYIMEDLSISSGYQFNYNVYLQSGDQKLSPTISKPTCSGG